MSLNTAASLSGKCAIVTGASRGIGRGIAIHLAEKGVSKIAITYASNANAAEETIASIHKVNPEATTIAIQADICSLSFAKDVIGETLAGLKTRTIDIIVNNAAMLDPTIVLPTEVTTKESFDALMTGNAWTPLQVFLTALPHIPRGGRVINISSTASKTANADPVLTYGASKAALDSYTRSLALLYSAKHGITINSVSVGATMTDTVRIPQQMGVLPPDFIPNLVAQMTADNRIGEVEDIAWIVGFLASPESRWINGNNVPANGGSLLELQG